MTNLYYPKQKLLLTGVRSGFFLVSFCFFASIALAQEIAEEDDHQPVRPAFESTWLIDNQTTVVPSAKTFQFDIQHRFGTVENGFEDLFGMFAPSNIRLGLSYTIRKNLSVGFGTTKNQRLQDFNLKYAIVQQTRSDKIPVSVTYFGNATLDARSDDFFYNTSDRLSYFHQVIISRRFTHALSVQVAPSLSHFNLTESTMNNDHFAIASGLRYKFSSQSSILVNYDQPLTKHDIGNPHPNISFGVEIATSSHAFQIFMGNYQALVPQYNNVFNTNDFEDGDFLIGFNITRLWNF
jgi:hypothetical protein